MRIKRLIVWFAGVFLFLTLAVIANAQDQKKKPNKEDRLSGAVQHDLQGHLVDHHSQGRGPAQGCLQRRNEIHTPE
jgi:hypothetical protein